jgi:hypothetical protein
MEKIMRGCDARVDGQQMEIFSLFMCFGLKLKSLVGIFREREKDCNRFCGLRTFFRGKFNEKFLFRKI